MKGQVVSRSPYWIHWLGVKYYSISSFIDEARRMGVSRRIPPQVLKGMSWGDSIFMIGESPKFPGYGILFGKFYVDRVKFATKSKKVKEDLQELMLRSKVKLICEAPHTDKRGCGTETSGGYYLKSSAKVKEIGEILAKGKGSRVNIAGPLYVFKKPILLKITPFRGYRSIEQAGLEGLISRGKEISYKNLEGSIDVTKAVEGYLRAYINGNKKALRKLRKIFKADGVWGKVKSIARVEIEKIRVKRRGR